jgi:hypothetical protein
VVSAPDARSAITPEAKPVVERYLAATGGRAAFESIRSTTIKATAAALGFEGVTWQWSVAPDHHGTYTKLGPLEFTEGYDGKVAWRTDPTSGKLVILDGKDFEDAEATAYFENDRWLAADQGGGTITLGPPDSTGAYDVLVVTPPAGRERVLYVNRKTGLIDRATSQKDQLVIVSTISDYRPVGGRKLAFSLLTQIVGLPANDLLITIDSVWVNTDVPASRFAKPGATDVSARFLKDPHVASIPFDYSGRHVWLRASVNGGAPADFIFDTGASVTVIDSGFAARNRLETQGKIQSQGAGATGGATFSRLATLRVASADGDGVEIKDVQVAVLSINRDLAPFFWRECAGVIGYDFISRFVVRVDYDHHRLTLTDPTTFRYSGGGEAIPFTLAGTMPAIRMTLDGRYTGEFRVDVGSSSTVDLHAPFVRQNRLDDPGRTALEVTGGGFGGTFSSRLTRMKTLEIGKFSWPRPIVSFSGAMAGALASEDYAGNIGNQILERFTCTFDYDHRVLYLEPGQGYARPDVFSRSGVQLARYGDTVRAMQVLPGSPAAAAGLREGDEVVTLLGKPILSFKPDDLTELFERGAVGKKVSLEVARDGKKKPLTLSLRDLL